MLKWKYLILIFLSVAILFSCSRSEDGASPTISNNMGFQDNSDKNSDDAFEILSVMKDGGALQEVHDSLDGTQVTEKLSAVIDEKPEAFIGFSETFSSLLDEKKDVIINLLDTNVKSTFEWITGSNPDKQAKLYNYAMAQSYDIAAFYEIGAESDFTDYFYSFLDQLSEDSEDGSKSGMEEMINVGYKIMTHMIETKSKAELRDDIQEIIDDLLDPDFEEDFIDISQIIGKLLIQADYPIWIDDDGNSVNRENINPDEHSNTGVGNVVSGMNTLFQWINETMVDETNRDLFHDVLRKLTGIFNPETSEKNMVAIKKTIANLEDYFTEEGKEYSKNDSYSLNDDKIYSNTELSETAREMFPTILQLVLRSDRDGSMLTDNDFQKEVYPIHQMIEYLKNLQFDPDEEDIEQSLINVMKVDLYGRDRTDPDSGAHSISMMENQLFTVAVASNLGWDDGGNTGEINEGAADVRKSHGHGETVDYVTLNDSLFSMKTHALLEYGSTALLGLFDLGFRDTDGNNISRAKYAFHKDDMGSNSFFFNQNYRALSFLSGAASGDLGTPEGGNIDGSDETINSYRNYNPTGRDEYITAVWVDSWIVRSCYGGEGPFYYADPDAETVTIDDKTYYKYMRPNGKVYALVNKDSDPWEYIYPTDKGDEEDSTTSIVDVSDNSLAYDNKRERYNRYKAEWDSDYYMMKYLLPLGHTYQIPAFDEDGNLEITSAGKAGNAGALHFIESVPENEERRACSSPLEALYRNYQWVWYEKKFPLIIPMYMSINMADLNLGSATIPLGCAFQMLECNGMFGIASNRKFRGNNVWAKTGEKGTSNLPGDYRFCLAASLILDSIDIAGIIKPITQSLIYQMVFDVGTATPAIIGRNLESVARFGFPLSPEVERTDGVFDRQVGSLDFEVGDEIWENRNAVLPVMFSIFAALYENTPGYPDYTDASYYGGIKHGHKNLVEGLLPLLKPLFYYQKDQGQVPYNTWKPRVQGDENNDQYADYIGNGHLLSTADFYDSDTTLTTWDGCEAELRHYLPANYKTPFNVLVDSDLTNAETRMDGLLPTILSQTKAVSALLKLLLSETNDAYDFSVALEQILPAIKTTKGEMTKLHEGPDSYGAAGSTVKEMHYPNWMFATAVETIDEDGKTEIGYTDCRSEDFILDNGLDDLIGKNETSEAEGYGLSDWPDDKPDVDYDDNNWDAYLTSSEWEDFEDTYQTLVDLLYEDSEYAIIEGIINTNEAVLGKGFLYSDEQVKGFLYCLGKLFTYFDYDKNSWVYQGEDGYDDIYKILTESLPELHEKIKDDTGDNYYNLLAVNSEMMKEDGMLNLIIDLVEVEADWEDILSDLEIFLTQDFIINDDPLWSELSTLLKDFANAIEPDDAESEARVDALYKKYGFQKN
jgi:hypothetical protein